MSSNKKSVSSYGFTSQLLAEEDARLEFMLPEILEACQKALKYEQVFCESKLMTLPKSLWDTPDYVDLKCHRQAEIIARLLEDEKSPMVHGMI